jgi:chorismate mutase/prephenate dehydratase
LEAPQRVAVLGPQGTFCEQAAIEFFGSAVQLSYCANFDEVFHATAAGAAQFGVVGMENTSEGVVARSLDLFLRSPVHVVGEVSLLVRHNLMRLSDSTEGIEVVMAHPQALAQCQTWLTQHLPHAERRAVSSNAEGARLAATNPAWAGIASERAANQFGLHIVAPAIQDEAHNRTRFAVICLPQTLATPPASGTDAAKGPTSSLERMICKPSRSHCTVAPPINTLPSRAKAWAAPAICAARVVNNPCALVCAVAPVCISKKHPVP